MDLIPPPSIYSQLCFIPTCRHFLSRQPGHFLRVMTLISQLPSSRHLVLMFLCTRRRKNPEKIEQPKFYQHNQGQWKNVRKKSVWLTRVKSTANKSKNYILLNLRVKLEKIITPLCKAPAWIVVIFDEQKDKHDVLQQSEK